MEASVGSVLTGLNKMLIMYVNKNHQNWRKFIDFNIEKRRKHATFFSYHALYFTEKIRLKRYKILLEYNVVRCRRYPMRGKYASKVLCTGISLKSL